MPARIDVVGRKFGRLLVLADAERSANRRRTVRCLCDCGNETINDPRALMAGHTKSCGCLQRETVSISTPLAHTTHGCTRTVEYNTWIKLRDRCGNPGNRKFAIYGGRGIRVCPEWDQSFEAFLRDMGEKPHPSWSIDRIDVDGHYEPANCRWASPKTQSRNKRAHRFVELGGAQIPLSEACERTGINYRSALYRLNVGKDWRPLPPPPAESIP